MPQISDSVSGSIPTVAPSGEVDLASARDLTARLHELAGANGHDAILDLTRVAFMDSVGLGAVLKAANRFHRQSKRLLIVAPPESAVLRLLEFAGVTERLAVVPTVEEAYAVTRHG
jgi:anti-sigma B factor antagonist